MYYQRHVRFGFSIEKSVKENFGDWKVKVLILVVETNQSFSLKVSKQRQQFYFKQNY